MPSVEFLSAVDRKPSDKWGERISVLDYGALGDGVADDAPAFRRAYLAAVDKGGCSIDVPGAPAGGFYRYGSNLVLDSDVPVTWRGHGRSSKIVRDVTLGAGVGLIDIQNAKHLTFERLLVDGQVTTSAGLLYSDFGGDPAHNLLTAQTSYWVHGGEDIQWIECGVEHTGGYAIYLDARAHYVRRIQVKRSTFRNNRPHLFGTTIGAENFGSWTGGVFYQNTATGGSAFRVEDLTVDDCDFQRNTGNCVWGHAYGFDSLHQRVKVTNSRFVDCGLDGALFGNVVGGSATGNSFRRIGYVCTDDTSPSVPRWLPSLNATGLDTSGVVRMVVYANNDFVSINGGAINGDGFAMGAITGNTMRIPRVGDLEYTEDSIASFGPGGVGANWSQGIVLGNTANLDGGLSVTISGNVIDNFGGVQIGLYAARRCTAIGNTLIVPAAANQAPVGIGGLFAGANQVATQNVVTANSIHYDPAAPAPAVLEDSAYRAFTAAERNTVSGNRVFGAVAFEFAKDPNSSSGTAETFSTAQSGITAASSHAIQREGSSAGSTSALKVYFREGSSTYAHMQLQGYHGGGLRSPLLNVSEGGTGGIISTGSNTGSAFTHAVLTGKMVLDGFAAFKDSGFLDAEADLLDGTYALLRWNSTLNRWRQSVTVSAGHRVWTDFAAGGGGSVAGSDKWVQFNDGGAFGATADLQFDKTLKRVTIAGIASTIGLSVTGGDIDSAGGFVTANTAFNATQAPSGGMSAVSYYSLRNDEDSHLVMQRTASSAHSWGLNINSLGFLYFRDRTFGNNSLVLVPNASVAASVVYTSGYFQSDVGFLSTGSSYQTVNAGSGGSFARSHRSSTYTALGQSFGTPTATTGDAINNGCTWYDTNTNLLMAMINGSAVSLGSGGGGSAARFTASNTGSSITFDNSNGLFQVNGNGAISAAGVIASTGASGGVNVTAQSATNSIQTVGGFNAGSGGGFNGVYQVAGVTVINSSRQFVGAGVDVGASGINAGGYNVNGGFIGQTALVFGTFTIGGLSYTQLIFKGGILVSYA